MLTGIFSFALRTVAVFWLADLRHRPGHVRTSPAPFLLPTAVERVGDLLGQGRSTWKPPRPPACPGPEELADGLFLTLVPSTKVEYSTTSWIDSTAL